MLNKEETNRVIEMAWEDRTPFEVIHSVFDLTHNELIALMRNNLKPRSFHIMFIDLTKSFNKTSYQKVKFNFENAGSIIINMPIINKAKISKDKKKHHHY